MVLFVFKFDTCTMGRPTVCHLTKTKSNIVTHKTTIAADNSILGQTFPVEIQIDLCVLTL